MRKIIVVVTVICCCISAAAQVAVRDEPRHHNVFCNEYVRVLDVYLPPGDTSLYHLHNTPSVFIPFTKTTTEAQLLGQTVTRGTSEAGGLWYDSLVVPRVHRVWNVDSTWFHVMDIELINTRPGSNQPELNDPLLKLLYNEQRVNVYRLQLSAGGTLKLPVAATGYFVVSVADAAIRYQSNGTNQQRAMKAGHYIWIEAGVNATLTNTGPEDAGFILMQLK